MPQYSHHSAAGRQVTCQCMRTRCSDKFPIQLEIATVVSMIILVKTRTQSRASPTQRAVVNALDDTVQYQINT